MEFFLFLLVKAYLSSIFTNYGILVFVLVIPVILNSTILNSYLYKLVSYHLTYGRFFDIHFRADSPLKIFVTPPFLPPLHDLFSL